MDQAQNQQDNQQLITLEIIQNAAGLTQQQATAILLMVQTQTVLSTYQNMGLPAPQMSSQQQIQNIAHATQIIPNLLQTLLQIQQNPAIQALGQIPHDLQIPTIPEALGIVAAQLQQPHPQPNSPSATHTHPYNTRSQGRQT